MLTKHAFSRRNPENGKSPCCVYVALTWGQADCVYYRPWFPSSQTPTPEKNAWLELPAKQQLNGNLDSIAKQARLLHLHVQCFVIDDSDKPLRPCSKILGKYWTQQDAEGKLRMNPITGTQEWPPSQWNQTLPLVWMADFMYTVVKWNKRGLKDPTWSSGV